MTTTDHVRACSIVRRFTESDGAVTVTILTCVHGKSLTHRQEPPRAIVTVKDLHDVEPRLCACGCLKTLPTYHKARKFATDACSIRAWRARKAVEAMETVSA